MAVSALRQGGPTPVRARSAVLRLYYLAVFAALGAFVPFFPSWLQARGIRGFELGLVTGVIPLASFVGPLVFGYLADRYSLRAGLIRVACLGACLSMAALGLLGGLGQPVGLAMMLGLIAIFAFFRSPLVMVADVSALETPADYGRLRLWGSIGFMLMAVAAGRWLDVTSATALPLFVGTSLGAALLISGLMPARAGRAAGPVLEGVAGLLRTAHVRLFLLVTVLWCAAHSGYDLVIGRHLRDLGGQGYHVGIAWGVGVAAEIALMALSGRWLARWSATQLLSVGVGGSALRWMLLAVCPSLNVALLLQPLHALSFGLTWLSALAFLRQHAPDQARGTAQGAFSAAAALGGSTGALAWGLLYEAQGGRAVFAVAAGVALVGFGCTLALQGSVRALANPRG